jgi:hypothetical protein
MSTMTFKLNNGEMTLANKSNNLIEDIKKSLPLSTAYIVDTPRIKESIKDMGFLKGRALSVAVPTLMLGMATGGSSGIFWDTFLQYIFPWLLDIAKVYCAIQIARSFYEERRGGRDGGTGFGALVTYGKWLLLFHLLPWGVELIDELGQSMWNNLKTEGISGS